jgi:glycosyltransferase involved in cell wall biosynthesis
VSPRRPKIIGGAEVSVGILARAFAALDDYRVYLASVSDSVQDVEEIEEDGVTHVIFPINRPSGFGKATGTVSKAIWHGIDDLGFAPRHFRRFVESKDFALAMLNNMAGFGWRAAKILKDANVPSTLTCRDYYYLCARMNLFDGQGTCAKTCMSCRLFTYNRKRIFDYVDRLIFVSREMMDLFDARTSLPPGKATYVHNPVELGLVRTVDRPWPETRIGFLGRNAPEKGLALLVDAIARMGRKTRLVIAGDFSDEDRARLIAGRDIDICFLGFCPPSDLFEQIDVLAVPSMWEEPFARVVLEATAFGVPSVVSSHGGLPAGVQYGESGWVVPGDAVDDWVRVLDTIDKHSAPFRERTQRLGNALDAFSTTRYVDFFVNEINRMARVS